MVMDLRKKGGQSPYKNIVPNRHMEIYYLKHFDDHAKYG